MGSQTRYQNLLFPKIKLISSAINQSKLDFWQLISQITAQAWGQFVTISITWHRVSFLGHNAHDLIIRFDKSYFAIVNLYQICSQSKNNSFDDGKNLSVLVKRNEMEAMNKIGQIASDLVLQQ